MGSAARPRGASRQCPGAATIRPGVRLDAAIDGVWAVTCFCVRKGFRGRAITYALAEAAAEYATEQGATAVEGYAMVTQPGKDITWGEMFVGSSNSFADAGFVVVSRPTLRRVVMRIDFR